MEIKNRDDFLIFLQNFINETDAREFENNTLSGFLEAMRYWIKDMDGYFDENIKWSVLADIFEAARIYEQRFKGKTILMETIVFNAQ